MNQRLLHTPEGVRDIYNEECEKKHLLQEKMHQVLLSYGYQDIETPTFEFFDVFGKEVGTIPSRELFKFFDREGNTLVLRPDFTPSIARAASKYFGKNDLSARLCYMGNTFINNTSYQGRLKESTQLGAEMIGDCSVDADAEIIAAVIETLKASGLSEFQISIGQTEFFKSLLNEAGIDEDTEEELKNRISNKNIFGVEELLSEKNIRQDLKDIFTGMPQLFGAVEVLNKARTMTENPDALKALKRLEELYEILKHYQVERYVSFDLGMISNYRYYTGIIFRGYTFGIGEAVVKGGRYDHLLGHFGVDVPSIGFVVVVDQLLNALSRQKIDLLPDVEKAMVIYLPKRREEAISLAGALRSKGCYTELSLMNGTLAIEEYCLFAARKRIQKVIALTEKPGAVHYDIETHA